MFAVLKRQKKSGKAAIRSELTKFGIKTTCFILVIKELFEDLKRLQSAAVFIDIIVRSAKLYYSTVKSYTRLK